FLVPVKNFECDKLRSIPKYSPEKIMGAKRHIKKAKKIIPSFFNGSIGRTTPINRKIKIKAELNIFICFLNEYNAPGKGRKICISCFCHGIIPNRFTHHIAADGPFISPIHGLKIKNRGVFLSPS